MEHPLFRRIRQHAAKRLEFADGAPIGERLPKMKQYMRLEYEMLLRYHRKGDSGEQVAKARSIMLDVLLESLFRFTRETYRAQMGESMRELSVIALGGYGREEVCPFSDVDVMFLYEGGAHKKATKAMFERITEEILYPMWDLKLKLGYSIRSLKEAMEEAKKEEYSKNAFLEARFICGSESLYQGFYRKFRDFYKNDNPNAYAKERLEGQAARRKKFGGTVFMQAPNVKNGVGGLRDYQNILWMTLIRFGESSLQVLEHQGILSLGDRKSLEQDHDFLLRVRNELHFLSNRPNDLLDLEKQPQVAWGLGYRQHNIFRRVEQFMKDYYSSAQRIYLISKLLEQRLAIGNLDASRPMSTFQAKAQQLSASSEYHDGFIISGHLISAESQSVFIEEPRRIMRVFRYLQEYEVKIDLDLQFLIKKSVSKITPYLVNDAAINEDFRKILTCRGKVFKALRKMNELGVLGRFVPEFGRLCCLVQHEYYHRYTIDFHILNTIKQLDKVVTDTSKELRHYREEYHKLDDPAILYLILLLHDIGKGEGIKGHDKVGVEISKPILKRLDVDPRLHEEILFIIGNHLEMARFWQHHDIDDPQNIQSFAAKVENQTQLNLLYIHTYCDACGTSSSLWNSYKDMLHRRLFTATSNHLASENSLEKELEKQKSMIYEKLLSMNIEDVSQEEIHAHCNLLPERYFVHNSVEELIIHIKLVNQLLRNISEAESLAALAPVLDWTDDFNKGHTAVTVVTWDRAGLFYRLAGSFSLAGLNIVSAKAINRMDHITIDTFYVCDAKGGIVQSKSVREKFEECLSMAVVENKDLTKAILNQSKSQKPSNLFTADKHTHTPFPETVDVYHEVELQKTVVEVEAYDQIGLLYFLGKVIYEKGYGITFARIATERNIAVDTFYIESSRDKEGGKKSTNLVDLKEMLQEVVASDAFKAVH